MKSSKGFTLIELMIVVLIMGVLAAIALPNYRTYVLRSHRTAAINAILALASQEARYYTINNSYPPTPSMVALGYAADPAPIPSTYDYYYNLSVVPGSVTATSFTLRAVPVGNQANDTCGTYTYTALGVEGNSGNSSTVGTCWQQ